MKKGPHFRGGAGLSLTRCISAAGQPNTTVCFHRRPYLMGWGKSPLSQRQRGAGLTTHRLFSPLTPPSFSTGVQWRRTSHRRACLRGHLLPATVVNVLSRTLHCALETRKDRCSDSFPCAVTACHVPSVTSSSPRRRPQPRNPRPLLIQCRGFRRFEPFTLRPPATTPDARRSHPRSDTNRSHPPAASRGEPTAGSCSP